MIIPGFLVSWATFPGVIVHEAAHMFFCRLRNVAVLDLRFFRFGNPAGYVIHEPPQDFTSNFLIAMGPFIINSLLCIAICFPASIPVMVFDQRDPLSFLLLWLGLSIGMHAFPSTQDASSLWGAARDAASQMNPLAIISFPLIVAVYLANFGAIFWLDYLYGVALGLGLPKLLLENVA